MVARRRLRLRFLLLLESIWRLYPLLRFILPLPVTVNRLAAELLVLIFGTFSPCRLLKKPIGVVSLCENSLHGSIGLTTNETPIRKCRKLAVRPEHRRRAPTGFTQSARCAQSPRLRVFLRSLE